MDTIELWEEEIAVQQEAAIYNFYDDGTSFNEGVIDVLKGTIDKIKKVIVNLIEDIEELLSKGNDNKFKSIMRNLLSKAKNALTKADKIESKEDAKELAKEVKEISDKSKGLSEEFKEAVKSGKTLRVKIMIKDSMLLDKTFYLSNNEIKYAIDNGIDLWEEDNGYGRQVITSEDALNTAMIEFVQNFSKTRYNDLKRGVKYLYLEDHSKDKDDDEDYL